MGKRDVYSVHTKGERVVERYRGDEIVADEYFVIKYNELDMETGLYTISVTDSHSTCDCPAGRKPSCRHRELVPIFIEKGYVDKIGVRYSFDKKTFTVEAPQEPEGDV